MKTNANPEIGKLFGQLYSFNESLKLYHWHDTGEGSYARHMATDQAVDTVRGLLDRLVETSYSVYGQIEIVIPQTGVPPCLVEAIKNTSELIARSQSLFQEGFLVSILDEYQEALHQLNYRITRLK
ncbi:MAG: hypothetical protein LIO77_09915 [Rikenellaceae bacterium]|nr:hypothetical protein [Rikenellaceae bacterium]